ncbi:MAG: hypothetical protein ACT4PU_08820 [Planctomycetota bacterium]
MLPGLETAPLDTQLPDAQGTLVSLAALRGQITLVGALPLGDALRQGTALESLIALRRRLRGLGNTVNFVLLCSGGDPKQLEDFLVAQRVHRPNQIFLADEGSRQMLSLATAAGSPSADWLLLDRHGRARGVYDDSEAGRDSLVAETGQLANWAAQDPPPTP